MILHFDLDAFFASVEQRLDPALRGKPVAVGGRGGRGVVATASYEARRSGVGSAMPMSTALARCPRLVVVAPRFAAYQRVSAVVMALARELGPTEAMSLDEAYVEVGGEDAAGVEAAVRAGRELRRRVRDATGLAVSVGVASSKVLAKIASDDAKPDGLRLVRPEHARAYLSALDVGRISGVGPVARARLGEIGVRSVGELAETRLETLVALLGESSGTLLSQLARNDDPRRVTPVHERKSVGYERTLENDVADPREIERLVREAAWAAARRLRRSGMSGRTVVLKARLGDFTTLTRSVSVAAAVDDPRAVEEAAMAALSTLDLSYGVRLLGVSVSALSAESHGVLFTEVLEEGDDVEDEAPLREAVSWNARVRHHVFGEGRVVSLHDGALEVRFTDRVRVLDVGGPLELV